MKNIILTWLFGKRAEKVCDIKLTLRTVHPKQHAKDFGDWCNEFNVSMLHDRKPYYLN
tara:strand:- start:796 stop:969 length:174 start_codon:yes stop_codon:yes gene_type:complete